MTQEQIKALAKQAGGVTWESDFGAISATFRPDALIEFVRLVRERAFDDAADVAFEEVQYQDGISSANKVYKIITSLK